MDVVVA